MKKFIITLSFSVFCASALLTQAFAAPQNTRQGTNATQKRAKAQRATGGGALNNRTTKAAAKKAAAQSRTKVTSAQRTKAQERKEARNQEFGLMPSELDSSNHNVFHADAAAIKGARDTESALRYLPFVTIINTAGFGQQFDLRGQGRLSSNGVKLYINGVPANPVDTYSNAVPINTIIPSLISEVSVTPGGGAVLYGSGAKGGTINIITSTRTTPYFLVGGGYTNTTASKGNSFNVFAQASEDISRHIKMNAGLGFNQLGGPREDDSQTQGQAVVGAWYDIGWGQAITADIDVFYGKTKTTPYNSFLDDSSINETMTRYAGYYPNLNTLGNADAIEATWEAARYICLSGAPSNITNCRYDLYNFEPDKTMRANKGSGSIETTNIRAAGKLGWENRLTQNLKINVDAFYTLSQQKYDKYQMNLPYFVLGYANPQDPQNDRGYNWFLPRPHGYYTGYDADRGSHTRLWSAIGPEWSGDGQRADWHYFDQSGSTFKETKIGAEARMDYKHGNGQLFVGASSVYELSNKKQNSHLRQAIADGYIFEGVDSWDRNFPTAGKVNAKQTNFRTLVVDIFDKTDIKVLTNSIYVLERYDMSRNFSVMAGARYEMKNYDLKVNDKFEGQKLQFDYLHDKRYDNPNATQLTHEIDYNNYRPAPIKDKDGNTWNNSTAQREFEDSYKKNYDNFTFEFAPVYRYSNTGSIYARGEFGYIAPPAWAMLQRIGMVYGAKTPADIYVANDTDVADLDFAFSWLPTDLKSETYYTAELGFKELIGTRRIPLGITNLTLNALLFSANVFYTNSQNEFYFTGDTWSGMELGTYDKSRRMGVELAFEQYLFDGALGFNESFTYLKAQKFDCKDKTAGVCLGEKEWSAVPYTYDWKATLGAAVNVSTFVEITDVAVSIWLQNSIYGNQNIYATNMNVSTQSLMTGGTNKVADTNNPLVFYVTQQDDKKLKPYIISDFGVSVGLNKGMGVVTGGIKNLFDTFYYDYYNNDRSAVVNENRFVIGRGRTVFVEGTFRY